jgi:membrane associated rhomboid family serine protease
VLFGSETLPAEAQWVPATATIFTSMFPHGGFGHLIGNMLYLWIFGDNVEDSMGSGRFVLFYFVCGIAAALAQAVPAPDSVIPMIGASGAVSGVLGAYMLMYPRAHVLVLVPIPFMVYLARIPALFVLALWFGIQLLSSIAAPEGAGVAFRAHVGGFVAGALLIYLFRPRKARRED